MTECLRTGSARLARILARLLLVFGVGALGIGIPGHTGIQACAVAIFQARATRKQTRKHPRKHPGTSAGIAADVSVGKGAGDRHRIGATVGPMWHLALAGLTVVSLMALAVSGHAAPSVDPDEGQGDAVVLTRDVAPLSPRLRQAVLLDPRVAEANARACQLAHRLGLARAEGRPKVNASINTTQPENAMPFYETVIAIPEVAFTKSPETPVITAGMPLQVDILGGKRTIMNYIMTPIQKSLVTAFREK